jgi:oxygen-dependent protoporphyrinogen oxidase
MPARVIGAGLSGLVAAWHLADRGFSVTVSEAREAPGGLIGSIRTPHGLVETAANAFVWDETVKEWFAHLELEPQLPQKVSRRRYIYRDGRARRWPLTAMESVGMAARLARTAVTRSFAARDAETVAAWGTRVVGPSATRWLLEPAMQGVYAAPASSLSARVIFGRRRSRQLAAPPDGMGQFISRLYERLCDRGVRFEFQTRIEKIEPSSATVVATNAAEAARLVRPHAPEAADALAAVRIAPLTTVTMCFAPHPDDLRGFGVLFPPEAGIHALGVLFASDIFAGRGPLRTETWIVGDRDAGLTAWSDERLRGALAADRERLTGRAQLPQSMHITRWPQAIPVYDASILGVMAASAALPPWLSLAGNYLGRIGVAALLEQSRSAAERIAANMRA